MGAVRSAQRDATRARILAAAVTSLLEDGYSATSTVAVQDRAGISRGALLHHFPTRAALFGALVGHLVQSNEAAVRDALASAPPVRHDDLEARVRRALHVLHAALARPAFQAELELWVAARTDPALGAALRAAESAARPALQRVLDELLGADAAHSPQYRTATDLTTALLRGLVLALPLRDPDRNLALLDAWAPLLVHLLDPDGRPVRPRQGGTP